MAGTAEDRRRYAPAVQDMVRQGMLDPPCCDGRRDAHPPVWVGRPRVWSTLVMLQALWHVARYPAAPGRWLPIGLAAAPDGGGAD